MRPWLLAAAAGLATVACQSAVTLPHLAASQPANDDETLDRTLFWLAGST